MATKIQQVHESKTLSSGSTSTLSIPTGGKIQSLVLRFAQASGADTTVAAIKAEIGTIRLTLNGKDVVNTSATRLLDLYAHLGQNVDAVSGIASAVELNIGRLVYTDPAVRDLFGFGTNDVQSVQVSVTAGTLATISSVQAFTARDAGVAENLGVYMKFIDYPVSYNSTGDHTVDTLPRDPDSSYIAVMAHMGASGVMSHGELRVNNMSIKERCPRSVNVLLNSSDRVGAVANYYYYNLCDGNLKSRVPMVSVKDLRFINTFTTAPGAAGYTMSVLSAINLPTNI